MNKYFVEVFADQRFICSGTWEATNEATAMARAQKAARHSKLIRRIDTLFVTRARRLAPVKSNLAEEPA